MLQNCWKELNKRTVNWAEIRMTIEDQLTVQRNWNLNLSNPNPDMTGLKDKYRSGEENYLGKTGQVRMEVNAVTAPVRKFRSSLQLPTLLQLEQLYSIQIVRNTQRPGELLQV